MGGSNCLDMVMKHKFVLGPQTEKERSISVGSAAFEKDQGTKLPINEIRIAYTTSYSDGSKDLGLGKHTGSLRHELYLRMPVHRRHSCPRTREAGMLRCIIGILRCYVHVRSCNKQKTHLR